MQLIVPLPLIGKAWVCEQLPAALPLTVTLALIAALTLPDSVALRALVVEVVTFSLTVQLASVQARLPVWLKSKVMPTSMALDGAQGRTDGTDRGVAAARPTGQRTGHL
ncbi:hypothetical protein ACFZB9_22735 [Kitasatospora sp. NPDC008050]|uniref:hypothetical protein n=1 Tax=Kitasatospora sp. NPDC008050 TaxID=3364021 RepID=UPI0036EC7B29